MTLAVYIKPELQVELARQAAGLEAYAARLLEVAVHFPERQDANARQLEVTLEEMAQFAHKIPSLPDEAFSREDLYRDHN